MRRLDATLPRALAAAGALLLGCGPAASTSPDLGAAATAPRCSLAAPALPTGRLHVDGKRLRDEASRVVSLRGFNAGGRSKFAPYVPFDFPATADDSGFRTALGAYLDRAAGWGVDLLRVPFNWAAVEPVRGQDDAVFLGRYDALLDAAWQRGIRTVVDFHQDVYAEVYCGDGFPAWTLPGTPPAPHHDCFRWFENYQTPEVQAAFDRFWATGSTVQADYLALWQRMAARHHARAGVIGFEPFNEPNAGSLADNAAFEAQVLTPFYARVVALLNTAAPDALVFLDASGQSSASFKTSLGRPAGENLVFAPHYYQLLTIFGGDGRPEQVLPNLQALVGLGDALGLPVVLGEWGAGQAAESSPDLVAAHYDAFDTLGISGTQWQYSAALEKWNQEPLDVIDDAGKPLPLAASFLRPHARALAGTASDTHWDGSTGTWSLRYAPDPGAVPSEIALPVDASIAGWSASGTNVCVDDSVPGRLLVRADAGATDATLVLTRK